MASLASNTAKSLIPMIAPIALVGASSYWSYQKFETYDKLFASVMQRNMELEDLIIRLYKENKKTYKRVKKLEHILWTYNLIPSEGQDDQEQNEEHGTRQLDIIPPAPKPEPEPEDDEDEIGYDDSDDDDAYAEADAGEEDHESDTTESASSSSSGEDSESEEEDGEACPTSSSSDDEIVVDDKDDKIHLSEDGETVWDPEKQKWYKATGKIGKSLLAKMKVQESDG